MLPFRAATGGMPAHEGRRGAGWTRLVGRDIAARAEVATRIFLEPSNMGQLPEEEEVG